jgi:hypothetical protein
MVCDAVCRRDKGQRAPAVVDAEAGLACGETSILLELGEHEDSPFLGCIPPSKLTGPASCHGSVELSSFFSPRLLLPCSHPISPPPIPCLCTAPRRRNRSGKVPRAVALSLTISLRLGLRPGLRRWAL